MSELILTVTDAAAVKIAKAVEADTDSASALRVVAREEGAVFRYELKLVALDSKTDEDRVLEVADVTVLIDETSAEHLQGATLDYVDDLSGAGLKIDNPNKTKLARDPLAARVQEVLDDRVNPGLAGHGGRVSLMDIQQGRVVLEFGGGCQGCGMVDVTLKEGVVAMLQQEIPEIIEVLDVTDHAAGENPYYS